MAAVTHAPLMSRLLMAVETHRAVASFDNSSAMHSCLASLIAQPYNLAWEALYGIASSEPEN